MDVGSLSRTLKTSSASIRRDLRALEKLGRIVHTHGKAIYRKPEITVPIDEDPDLDPDSRDRLANRVAKVLDDAENIFISSGDICAEVAARLSERIITTNSLKVAMAAAARPQKDICLVGQVLDPRTLSLALRDEENDLGDFHFDVVLVEADAVDPEYVTLGRTKNDVAKAAKKRASATVIIARKPSFERKAPRIFAASIEVDVLVSDVEVPKDIEVSITSHGGEVHVATVEDGTFRSLGGMPDELYISDILGHPEGEEEDGEKDEGVSGCEPV
jgi:DeoR/GlpR family transcriptional regulator of sugar metabolism